jgi:RNA polymerase sigma-70 factor (ECF subfamily)
LFMRFAPRVKAYLLQRGLDAAVAEELAQEVLLIVWRKAAQFDPVRASAATWIFTIARNLRIDAARRTQFALPPPDPVDDPPATPTADAILAAETAGPACVPPSPRCRPSRRTWFVWPSSMIDRTPTSSACWAFRSAR